MKSNPVNILAALMAAARNGKPLAKRCIVCREVKLLENFQLDRARADGFQNVCRKCRRTYGRPVRATRMYTRTAPLPSRPSTDFPFTRLPLDALLADPAADAARRAALDDMAAEMRNEP